VAAFCALLAPMAAPASAQTPRTVKIDADGTVHINGLDAPPSSFLSADARAQLIARLVAPPIAMGGGIEGMRAATDRAGQAVVARWQAVFPSKITSVTMNGVRTDVVEPVSGVAPRNRDRVLIALHGGGFFAGAAFGGQAESIPLAGRGRIKVVAVDYRLTPEAKFPAASEDVEQVYRALLKTYKPANIGIYGCSAGGTLVAQSLAWFQHRHLPSPGAAGIFCSGALPSFWYGGDSSSVTPVLNGHLAATPGVKHASPGDPYLDGVDQNDPLVAPALFPKVLAQFPPILLVTGTRDIAMSNALATNSRLLDVGVQTQLFVQEGLGHGEFNTVVGSPEAGQAYDVIWRFFDAHLAR
jgi:acetyl esterase/lipase